MAFRNRHLVLLDALSLAASASLAYALRFETLPWGLDGHHLRALLLYAALTIPARLGIFFLAGLYRRLWRHASISELRDILRGATAGGALAFGVGVVLLPASGLVPARVPLSVLGMDALLVLALVAAPRLLWRAAGARAEARRRARVGHPVRRAIVVGAGQAGKLMARELLTGPHADLLPVAFLDDDPAKRGHALLGLPIHGPIDDLPGIARALRAEVVVIAMPSAPGSTIRRITQLAGEARLQTRTVPGLFEIISGRVAVSHLREVRIEDLLRREPVQTDLRAVSDLVEGRTVLVTGAGGSIGSELSRQIAALDPARLLLLGQDENAIFAIERELKERFPDIALHPVIANIRDRARLMRIFAEHRPHAVFHAAAHKHVPLMEANPAEAILNNVLGTRNVVDAAARHDAARLVQISTDKAVRPTSIMGATKRCAELVAQHAAATLGKNFVSVRFGNVLGSNGSVVPTFLWQIREGRPITITHPEMVRYFMTIPEAVQLVLQAATLGRGGEVFVLDMGEPVKIVDLARDLIRLSGLVPDEDVEIRFTGVRPGEKLYEEMFFDAENATPTAHPKILHSKRIEVPADCAGRLDALIEAAEQQADEEHLRVLLRALVPDFGHVAVSGEYVALPSPTFVKAVTLASRE